MLARQSPLQARPSLPHKRPLYIFLCVRSSSSPNFAFLRLSSPLTSPHPALFPPIELRPDTGYRRSDGSGRRSTTSCASPSRLSSASMAELPPRSPELTPFSRTGKRPLRMSGPRARVSRETCVHAMLIECSFHGRKTTINVRRPTSQREHIGDGENVGCNGN
jgi:hypothetical protein